MNFSIENTVPTFFMRPGKFYQSQVYLWSAAITIIVFSSLITARTALSPASLAGVWIIDTTASDDFNAKLDELIKTQRKRSRSRQIEAIGPGERPAPDPDDLPPESEDRVRSRLTDSLRPASELTIQVSGTVVELIANGQPGRTLIPGQVVSRMDADGTAQITTSWSGSVLAVRSNYTHRERRVQQFSTDRTGKLHVLLQVSDPAMGKIELHSFYTRKPPN